MSWVLIYLSLLRTVDSDTYSMDAIAGAVNPKLNKNSIWSSLMAYDGAPRLPLDSLGILNERSVTDL
jgi:hypothetical protein